MKETFRWNPYADQPHNVATRKERFLHHWRYAGSYLELVAANLRKLAPILVRYRKYRKQMFRVPVDIGKPFGVAVSPDEREGERLLPLLQDLGITHSLLRFPSWEKERVPELAGLVDRMSAGGIEVMPALLQRRNDVLDLSQWRDFVEEVFSRLSGKCCFFEIGHAWNRTKWGVWNHREYLELAHTAISATEGREVRLVGPAVIDFEFHLYPVVLRRLAFDKVSSLLYVDRMGAPENRQFGWDLNRKLALLKAAVDKSSRKGRDLWITEVNWPLQGTGKYSPAAGKPNVSEEEQADFLVRYYVLALAGGCVERITWWQLAAPGYGLVDNREDPWRKRPAYTAYKTMATFLQDSIYEGRFQHPQAVILVFCRGKEVFAVGWSPRATVEYAFPGRLKRAVLRDGRDVAVSGNRVRLNQSPQYLFFEREQD